MKDERRLRSDFRLRFTPQDALAARISAAGLDVEHWFGDWNRGPVTAVSPEIIMVGRALWRHSGKV
jgi:hypothetical protein